MSVEPNGHRFTPFVSGSAVYAPHQDEPRIDAIDGAKGVAVILDPADVHIHALFRRERQSFSARWQALILHGLVVKVLMCGGIRIWTTSAKLNCSRLSLG